MSSALEFEALPLGPENFEGRAADRKSRGERILLVSTFIVAALLRVVAIFRFRIDSDETQHLHVVWGWTRGFLQYRDVFDNHMPLFHMIFAPVLRLAGERPETLIVMRLMMLAFSIAAAILTWRIAASCYSPRVAIWSAAFLSLLPGWFLCSTEFRPDTLWSVCWLAAIAIVVDAPMTPRRALAVGLLLGLAMAVSLKTSLLLVALTVGSLAAITLSAVHRRHWKRFLAGITPLLLGIALPPAAIAYFFAVRGAWRPFVYGTIGHNLVSRWHPDRLIAFPFFLLLLGVSAYKVLQTDVWPPLRARRIFLLVTTHIFGVTLFCFWPVIEREHWLPYYPLAVITVISWLLARESSAIPPRRMALCLVLLLSQVLLIIALGRLWKPDADGDLAIVRDALRLTRPDETIMDMKGETVFRTRPFYYVIETLTRQRMRAGLLRDTIIDDLLRTRTMVAAPDDPRYPPEARRFLRENYVDVGRLRVAGRVLHSTARVFEVRVPASYEIIGTAGPFHGLLDGEVYAGARYLAAGKHTLQPLGQTAGRIAFVWSRAVQQGFSPFGHNGVR